jgi:hypothetical protein
MARQRLQFSLCTYREDVLKLISVILVQDALVGQRQDDRLACPHLISRVPDLAAT